jgi:uncharacterized membrane protein YidH (DUF202 family)
MLKKKRRRTASNDYTSDRLPKNRVEVFLDLLKLRWTTILFLGLIVLGFFFPFIILRYYGLMVNTSILYQILIGEVIDEIGKTQIIGFNNLLNLIYIPLLALASIGLAGVMRIIKKLIWGQYMSLKEDFLYGIKENGFHFSLLFIFVGIINFMIGYFNYLNIETDSKLVEDIPMVAFIIFVIPIILINLSLTVMYKDKLLKKIKVSFLLYILSLPKTLIFLVAILTPLLVLLIPYSYIQLIFPMVYSLSFIPIILTAWLLYSCSIFDKRINPGNFPEIINKGIYIDEKEIIR